MTGSLRDSRVSGPKPSLRFKKPQTSSWCPYCGNECIWNYGFNSARTRRYKCSKCHKTFSLGGKKKRVYTDIFKQDIVFYYQIRSYGGLRSTAKFCGISTNTLYRWLGKYVEGFSPQPHKLKHKQEGYKIIPTGAMYKETLYL